MSGPLGVYAYHYAAYANSEDPLCLLRPALHGVEATWDAAHRVLRITSRTDSVPVYYVDDGWRFYYGLDAKALSAACSPLKLPVLKLSADSSIEVGPAGVCILGHHKMLVAHEALSHNILAMVTDGYGGSGGIARYNRDFLDALRSSPEVRCITVLARAGRSVPAKAGFQQLAPSVSKWIYSLRALGLALSLRPTMIFCGHLYMAPLVALVCVLLRIPYWLQVHGVEVFARPGPLIRWAVRRASLVTAVSRYTRARLLEWAGIEPERVRVLPNTVDERYIPGDREALKARHGYAGIKIILTVSRLDAREQYKGHDQVLAVMPALLKIHPKLIYLIAGDGSDRARLEKRAQASGLMREGGGSKAFVKFLGQVNDAELLELYQMADVFAMPSTGEGFGIVFLEAAACGCAVVGGNVDGSLDALGEGAIGQAVNPGSYATLQAAICKALESPLPDPQRASRFWRTHFERHLHGLLPFILVKR